MNKPLILISAYLITCSTSSLAANWSKTQLHVNRGEFTNPFTLDEAKTSVFSLQHASGYDYGDNFFFVDYIDDDIEDNYQDRDFYMEWVCKEWVRFWRRCISSAIIAFSKE